jgi:hypothetical protein
MAVVHIVLFKVAANTDPSAVSEVGLPMNARQVVSHTWPYAIVSLLIPFLL